MPVQSQLMMSYASVISTPGSSISIEHNPSIHITAYLLRVIGKLEPIRRGSEEQPGMVISLFQGQHRDKAAIPIHSYGQFRVAS